MYVVNLLLWASMIGGIAAQNPWTYNPYDTGAQLGPALWSQLPTPNQQTCDSTYGGQQVRKKRLSMHIPTYP